MQTNVPETPMPDTKDWTWAARSRCGDCGYNPAAIADTDLGACLRRTASQWQGVLQQTGVRVRPADFTWSPLEYACHVRDVHRLFADRVALMLDADDPLFAGWDQDQAAVDGEYWRAAPDTVAAEIATATEKVAAIYDEVPRGAWSRTGRRGDGGVFTVSSIGHYHLHDVLHHLWDVGA